MEKRQISWTHLLVVLAAAVMIFFTAEHAISTHVSTLNDQKRDLTVQLTNLSNQQDQLKADLKAVGTTGYIIDRARADYQCMQPGELRFEISNPEALGLTADTATDDTAQ